MYTIIGIENKNGVYEGKAYNNNILHCTYPKQGVDGICVVSLKVKAVNCPAVAVGDHIDVLYDRFGNVVHVAVEQK